MIPFFGYTTIPSIYMIAVTLLNPNKEQAIPENK